MSLPLYQRTRNTPKVNVSVARNLDILLIPIKKGKYATMIRCLDVISECRNVHRIDRHNLKSMLIPLLLPRLMLSSKCPQNQQAQNSPQTAKCALLCYGDIKEVFVCYDPMKRRILSHNLFLFKHECYFLFVLPSSSSASFLPIFPPISEHQFLRISYRELFTS